MHFSVDVKIYIIKQNEHKPAVVIKHRNVVVQRHMS
jgi:hypothetical protein